MNIPKGINWQESRQRFQVRVSIGDGKRIHVGRFKTLAQATRALAAAKRLLGA